jgi:hypothetical protein
MATLRRENHAASRRSERGSVLMISLLLLVLVSILGGLMMFLAQSETGIGTSMRSGSLAFNAAEYGLNLSINSLDPAGTPAALGTVTLPGMSNVKTWSGSKDGRNTIPSRQGASPCPPGYSLTLGCQLYQFNAMGQSARFLQVTGAVELETGQSIYQGCAGTSYGC